MPVPIISAGSNTGYVIWADFYRIHDMLIVDDAWINVCFDRLAELLLQLGDFRVTTLNPEWASPYSPRGNGLRPGEFIHLTFTETIDSTDIAAGGDSLGKADRNPTLYSFNESRVRVLRKGNNIPELPLWCAVAGAHETGHNFLCSAGFYKDASAHVDDPRNVMYGKGLNWNISNTWNDYQKKAAIYQIGFLRVQGLRYNEGGNVFKVSDGGIPSWPLQMNV